MKFKDKLIFYRKKNNLTQEVVADKLSVSHRSYIKWEHGKSMPRDLRVYLELAKLYSIPIDYLIDDYNVGKYKYHDLVDKNNNVAQCLFFIDKIYEFYYDKNLELHHLTYIEERIEELYLDLKFNIYVKKRKGDK